MNIEEKKSKLMEKFLDGSLNESQKIEFNKYLEEPNFRSELLLHSRVLDQSQDAWKKEILDDIINQSNLNKMELAENSANYDQNDLNKPKNLFVDDSRPSYGSFAKWAAIGLLLVFALIGYNTISNTDHTEDLFSEFYQAMPAESISRSSGPKQPNALSAKAMELYAQKNYSAALSEFKALKSISQTDYLFKGISQLETGDLTSAKATLAKINEFGDRNLKQNSDWYLSLIDLKNKDEASAIIALEKIAGTANHLYKKDAAALLAKLK